MSRCRERRREACRTVQAAQQHASQWEFDQIDQCRLAATQSAKRQTREDDASAQIRLQSCPAPMGQFGLQVVGIEHASRADDQRTGCLTGTRRCGEAATKQGRSAE